LTKVHCGGSNVWNRMVGKMDGLSNSYIDDLRLIVKIRL
jgi:hypothetical protein